MRHSALFARFVGVVMLAIVLTAVFTTVLYSFISGTVFTTIKENELLPKARALGSIILSCRKGEIDSDALNNLLKSDENASLLDAYVLAIDENARIVLVSERLTEEQRTLFARAAQNVIAQGELRTGQLAALNHTNLVAVGVPIRDGETPMGAVLMLVPLYEAMVGASSLNGALMLSLFLTLPIVAMLVYYAVGRIVRPLRQMRDVAITMAGGDFSAHADDTQRGEVGQLGRSLNYLSQQLSKSMSALTLERNRLRQTVDGLREGIVSVDSLGRVIHHNPALDALLGPMRRPDERDERLALVPDAQVWRDFEAAIARGESVARALTLPDRVLQVSISPITDQQSGKIAGAVGLFSDITESERLERTRRDYVANVSHELRSPLTAMRALVEPLREGMVTDEAARRRYYDILLRETLRLTRLINDLMELSRLQSGQLEMKRQVVQLDVILDDMHEKYAAIAEEHGLHFNMAVPPNFCPPVYTNADRVEQVLVILLDNAIKYSREGGHVGLEAQLDAQQVTLCVRDTGVGIDPKDQPYVFDRFYKVDRAHSTPGSGLGLSIAAELIRCMGEKIWLESEKDKGTAFFFTIKRA